MKYRLPNNPTKNIEKNRSWS